MKKIYKHKFKSKIPALTIVASVLATLGFAVGAGFLGASVGASMLNDASNITLLTVYQALGSAVGGLLGLLGGVIATVPVVQKVLNHSEKAGWRKTVKSNIIEKEDNNQTTIENTKENIRKKDEYMEYVVKEYLKTRENQPKHTTQSDEQEKE